MSEKRIAKLPKDNNWWGLADGGPCGPDTEIFYWVGDLSQVPESFNDDNASWVEIWNNVFMQFNKKKDGSYEPLAQKNVDTGMGLERILAVMNGVSDNYKTELFWPGIEKISILSGKKYDESPVVTRSMRIIADHLKAATLIMGDDKGIAPSNTDRGYVVRRLIRRAIRLGRQLGINQDFWVADVAEVVIKIYQDTYEELAKNRNFISEQLNGEEAKFKLTLEKGLREFEKIVGGLSVNDTISGEEVFHLYDTFGFPLELTKELAQERELAIDEKVFNEAFQKHQALSRTASAGMFKGGLSEASEATAKLHTATHLLLAALRQVLGGQVFQKGSNITPERLRLDFSYPEKMTPEQVKQVEDIVNQKIAEKLDVKWEEMSLDEAKRQEAMGVFEAKYGERVKVYTIFNPQTGEVFSQEICGGPHIENLGRLGHFKILKEEASSAGVRRIKAVLE